MQELDSPEADSCNRPEAGDWGSDTPASKNTMTGHDEAPMREVVERAVYQAMELALNFHRAGQLPQAEDAYRVILELVPDHGDANHNLAVIALESGHAAAAVVLFRNALENQPKNLTFWVSWFDAMLQCGDAEGATKALERRANIGLPIDTVQELIERILAQRYASHVKDRPVAKGKSAQPNVKKVDAINRLFEAGQFERVLVDAKVLTRRFPLDGYGWRAMGAALLNLGRTDQAMQSLRRAVELGPKDIRAMSNLGFALQLLGRPVESEVNLRLALKYQPDFAAAHVNLGVTLFQQDRHADAATCFLRSLQLEPGYLPSHNHMGQVNEESGRLVMALGNYRQTLALQSPTDRHFDRQAQANAHQGLCSTLAKLADFTQVREQTDLALALLPDDRAMWEKHLYYLSYHPDMAVADIFAQFVRWGDRHPLPQSDFADHDRTPGRCIRVGYVSPDFRRHTSRFYFLPLFANHDHAVVELHAYSNVKSEDAFTARFRDSFDHWHDIRGLNDEDAAAMIRADGIDILVDGCNHMRDERLGVFALKPAPIQVTWLGAAWTTGLPMIDYVLFDRHLAPPETLAREHIVRLPGCFVPFQSLSETPDPLPPPCLRNGYVTFAYSGRTERLNHDTFRVWGEILRRLPTARLVLDYRNFGELGNHAYFQGLMAAQGLDTERVTMRNSANIFEGLHDFDILLDCFPHSGGTMLVDALWMGVPALTLASRPPLGRIGTTFLCNIGLPQWVAYSEAEYIDKACAFAADVPMRVELRAGMRQRMLDSELMDGASFARGVEVAYRTMWERFCAGQAASPLDVPLQDGAR